MKNIKKKIIIIMLMTILCMGMISCEHTVENIFKPEPEYIEIAGFQVPLNTTELSLNDRNISDIEPLYSLTSLKSLDVRSNPINYADIAAFMNTFPNCKVMYSVELNGEYFDDDTAIIDFNNSQSIDINQLNNSLGYFTGLSEVHLSSSLITYEEYEHLKGLYPNLNFFMSVGVWGKWFGADETVISLSDCTEVNQDELLSALKYFDNLEKVELGNALNGQVLDERLSNEFSEVIFEREVIFCDAAYLSTVKKIDISGYQIKDLEAFKQDLAVFSQLEYIDMCECGLTNEQMEVLIKAYPDTKFVWMIRVGAWEMRTDVKAFGSCYSRGFEGGRFVEGSFYLEDHHAVNLKYCTDLEVLDIGHQLALTDFSFLKGMTKMKHLILALSKFEDMTLLSDMKDLEYLEIFNTRVADISSITELESLKYLNISDVLITSVDYLVEMDKLEWLWLCSSDFLSESELQRVRDSLPNARIETEAAGSTRGGWRSAENVGYTNMRDALDMHYMFRD